MPEIDEEHAAEPFDPERYLDVARRRYPHFLAALFLGWLVVWAASWIFPASYKSGTLILVEQPTMPKDYVTPNINEDLQDQLQNITQQILSRTRLLHIIDQLHLYSGGRVLKTPEEKVGSMRKDIQIKLVRGPSDQITAFNIYYSAHDPRLAQRVTKELTNLFINENLETRQQQSEDTTKFLQSQLEDARQNLAEQNAKIQKFKGEHEGELPSQQATNLQILTGLQSQLENEEEAVNATQQQRVYLQTLINQYRTLQGSSQPTGAATAGLTAIDSELQKMKSQLADLSSQYTDQYPDVRNLKVQIAKTEKMRDSLLAESRNKPGKGSPPGGGVANNGADPLQNSSLLQLQGQLHANEAELANRLEAIDDLKAKVNDYQGRLSQEPGTEQRLEDLTRGYAQSQANYDDLLKKETESQMATSMEQMQQGERFRMIDPPNLPLQPDFPNRLQFCGIALGFGLVLGVVVAGGFEFMDDRLHDEKKLKALLPMKVVVEIPEISNLSDEQSHKRKIFQAWVMASLVFAAILAGSAVSYLHS